MLQNITSDHYNDMDMASKTRYVVATRASNLALAQTNYVIEQLKSKNPHITYDTTTITTKGDTDARPLFAIDQKGIFEKEVDRAVVDGRADFAVHSLKDVPSKLPDRLLLASVPKRNDAKDILITTDGKTLEQMAQGAVIGTSSLRRAVQITRARPDITVRPIRGNVETRINMLDNKHNDDGDEKSIDGIILAHAGISRLKLDNILYHELSQDMFLPSPGQGALAIVSRTQDADTIEMLQKIQHAESRAETDAERAFSNAVDSGCRFPVGAIATCSESHIMIKADAFSIDGSEEIKVQIKENTKDTTPHDIGTKAGEEMITKGVSKLASKWREGLVQWNQK